MRFVGFDAGEGPRLGRQTNDGIEEIGGLGELTQLDPDRATLRTHDPAAVRIICPVPRPGKIVCVGRNYRAHVTEQDADLPTRPLIFAKFANAVVGPGEPVVRPPSTTRLDLECELAVVIGRTTVRVSEDDALASVFGYTILNDISARDHQREDGQWLRAKGSDTFAPIGPAVVSAGEIGDPGDLRLRSWVNGELWQDATTDQMIFDVPAVIAFISVNITLEPGDVIATGTPGGVGAYRDPPQFLQPGDVVRCRIDGIGDLENPIVGG